MKIEVDCIVIGAGVVGLAIARSLQTKGRQVVLLEKERTFGTETSSRNSEVIHAGIYYQPGSLKATFCVRGRNLLYDYCEARGIPHERIGKIIVATMDAELATLETYLSSAKANGVDDLEWLDTRHLQKLEPSVRAVSGLWSPSTGIIDSHVFMQALLADFEMAGGQFVPNSPVLGGRINESGVEISLADTERTVVKALTVVNSAGLHAPALASRIVGFPREALPTAHYAIGHYYTLTRKSPFRHLIYPVANNGGLGIHATLDLSGFVRFGPDVRWRDAIDYTFDDSYRNDFVEAIRSYYPEINGSDLQPGSVGIRPKISGPGDPPCDFIIHNSQDFGISGLINLFGVESPGLTSSLAIADYISNLTKL